MSNDILIRPERPEDRRAVENLTREAFWNVYRPGCLEHYVLHVFRGDPAFVRELDLVMEYCGTLIGHVMFARAELSSDDGRTLPIMTFGPISIDPGCKHRGLGKMLLSYALDRAREMGVGAIAMTGNIKFYGHLGFVTGKSLGIRYWDDPDADYFLALELKKGFLDGFSGTFREPEAYFVDEKDAEAFDKGFPVKEKKVLPGQLTH